MLTVMVYELKLRKVGNSLGILLPKELLSRLNVQLGDSLRLMENSDGSITLTPIRPRPSKAKVSRVIRSTMNDYASTMKRLA